MHSQNLTWGYVKDTQYRFTDTYHKIENMTTSVICESEFFVVGPAYPSIPDPLLTSEDFPFARSWKYDLNGSQIDVPKFVIAVPTGNWSLLSKLALFFVTDDISLKIINSSGVWGFILLQNDLSYSWSQTVEFSKEDGVLLHEYIESRMFSHTLTYTLERTITEPKTHDIMYSMIAISSILVVLVLYQIKQKR